LYVPFLAVGHWAKATALATRSSVAVMLVFRDSFIVFFLSEVM
jgi:hypothetical protein